ncbi:MAG: right-handed parallel beta-helix repeat-containing protein [Candidatus Hydrogenedentes bacterium]|nr:right-handed parallel beta-helix repeat-containing protein [Candidatus Hydrogenedentota bacterium]
MQTKLLQRIAIIFFLLGFANQSASAQGDSKTISTGAIYVSPSGNDANAGTFEDPFATPDRARHEVRGSNADKRIKTVVLRGGTYYLEGPLVLDERDSGEEGSPITWRAQDGEEAILAGGIRIAQWEQHSGRILKTALPQVSQTKADTFQVIEDGTPGTVARSPNEGWIRLRDPQIEPYWSFSYDDRDFDAVGIDASQLYIHLIQMGTYFSEHIPVERFDANQRRFYTKFKMKDPAYDPADGKTFVVENALALVDAPGEYFADRAAGVLYYMPIADDPSKATIVADTAAQLLTVRGKDRTARVHDLVIEGIRFDGGNDQVVITNASRVAFRDCRLLRAGNTAISVDGASSYDTVTGCEIAYCGNYGIHVRGEYEKNDTGSATVLNHHHTFHNNYIHHVGRRTITGCGISFYWSANDNILSNNLITDSPKSGIIMFSMWDIPRELGIMNNNLIRNNELARCVSSSWDGGAFYIGATTENNTFENNRITDVWSWFNATWPQPEDRPEDACAIDFDPGMTYNTTIRNNVAYGPNATVLEFGRYGDETVLENNFFESPGHSGEMLVNGKWEKNADFDRTKVDTSIGLTSEFKFAYPKEIARPISFPLHCGFEGTLSPFHLYRYNDGLRQEFLATNTVHDGSGAVRIDKDVMVLRYRHPEAIAKKVSLWFYDDASKSNATALATLRGHGAVDEAVIALGVDARISASHYIAREWQDRATATSVPRSTGWHQLVLDVISEKNKVTELSIDNQVIARVPVFHYFTTVELGDADFGTDSVGLGFDSVVLE